MLLNRIAIQITFFINGFLYANWGSRLPRIQELYHADNGTIGIVLLASSLGAVGAMPFAGWVIIRHGSRKITLVTVLLYCILVPLIPIMPGIASLIAVYFLMGIATGMLDVAMNAQAVIVEGYYQKPIMTSFHAFFSIGMALGAWCGALFADIGIDLVYHFSIVVILSLAGVAWASRNFVQDKPDPSTRHEGPLFRLPNQALIGIGIITFCCMLGEGAISDWSVNYMENITRASKTLAPIGLSAFATAMTLGRLFGDRLRAKLGDKKMITLGSLLSTAGVLIPLIVPLPAVAIAGFFITGLGLSTIVPIGYSIAGNTKDLPAGVGLAMVTTVGYSGFLFGPPIIGFIADWLTLRAALGVVALLFVVMSILGIRYRQK